MAKSTHTVAWASSAGARKRNPHVKMMERFQIGNISVWSFVLLACLFQLQMTVAGKNITDEFNATDPYNGNDNTSSHINVHGLDTNYSVPVFENSNTTEVLLNATTMHDENTVENDISVMVYSSTKTVYIPSSSQPIRFDIYQQTQTSVYLTTSDDHDDIRMTLNTTGTSEQAVGSVQLYYRVWQEDNGTVIWVTILKNGGKSDGGNLELWKFLVPIILCILCVIVVAVCLLRYYKRKRLRCGLKPTRPAYDHPPRPKPRATIATRYLTQPSITVGNLNLQAPPPVEPPYDRSAYIINRPRPPPYRMEGDLERISEERESETGFSSTDEDDIDGESLVASEKLPTPQLPPKSYLDMIAENLPYIDCTDSEESGDERNILPVNGGSLYDNLTESRQLPMAQSTFRPGSRGGLISVNGSRPFSLTIMLTVTMVTALAMVYAIGYGSTQSTLTISVPSNSHIRKVRSYSRDPMLDIVSLRHEAASLRTAVQMYDIEECTRDGSSCKAIAACDNFIGSYKCRCRTGFYVKGAKCQACSTTCPENHYMTQPCIADQDVVCKPCTVCNGSTYEAASCSTTQDRVCIDVTYPVKGIKENFTVSLNDDGTVSTSSSANVFLEKLTSSGDLETTMYFTNNQQSNDLNDWKRESGLEVALSIKELYLVPEYRDIDHVSDNTFIQKSARSTEIERNALKDIQTSFCRHPVPDKYNLGLSILPDRTTVASVVTCGSHNSSISCPKGYPDGQEYLYRSLNDACPKSKSQEMPDLKHLPNSIVCTDDVSLLHDVFGIPNLKPEAKSYPSPRCEKAQQSCDQCLQQTSCVNASNPSQDNCCYVTCYNGRDCKLAFSPLCPPPPIECATGNAYVYTLEPNFRSLTRRFQCHMKFRETEKLYQVGYSVRIPGLSITLEKRLKDVTSDNMAFRSSGQNDVGFITLKHDVGMQIPKDVILTGKYNSPKQKAFVLYPLKEVSDLHRNSFRVDQPHESSYLTSVQFENPFDYSSATWWNGECAKNLSKLYPAQRIYRNEPVNVTASVTNVNGEFRYQTLSQSRFPSIRISIPGNRSVLSTYKDDMSDAVLNISTLIVRLSGDWPRAVWILQIEGEMTACPGILSFELYDKCAGTMLGQYDVLVDCPMKFNIVLDVAQQNYTFTPAVYGLVLKDVNSTYRMYLSAFQKPFYLPIEEEDKAADNSPHMGSPWKLVIAMTAVAMASLLLIGLIYACVSHSRNDDVYIAGQGDRSPTYLSSKELERLNTVPEGLAARPPVPRRNMSASRTLLVLFSILYIVYSILFTLSVFFGVLYLSYGGAVSNIDNITAAKLHLRDKFTEQVNSLTDYEEGEVTRLSELAMQRQKACGFHLEREVDKLYQGLDDRLLLQLEGTENRTNKLEYALLSFISDKAASYDVSLEKFLSIYNESLQEKLDNIYINYKDYLGKVPTNGWLKFAKLLYESLNGKKRPVAASNERSLVKFLTWIGVDKVKDVLNCKEKLNERLLMEFPRLSTSVFRKTSDGKINLKTSKRSEIESFLMKFITVNGDGHDGKDESESASNSEEFYKGDYQFHLDALGSGLLPVILCALVLCDVLLFVHRIVRLCKILQQMIWGFKEQIPLDHISGKIFEITEGRKPPKPYDPLEHPYNYLKDHKEDVWSPGGEMYFFPQNMPKAKEDLLRDIWNHKKKQKPQMKGLVIKECCCLNFFCAMWSTVCRVISSKFMWKFIVILVCSWIVCVLVKLVDGLVTMETFQYLLSVDILLPQLRMHYNSTNANLESYAKFYNVYLRDYNTWMDSEVLGLNNVLQSLKTSQERGVAQLVNQACSVLENTTAAKDICDFHVPLSAVSMTIPSCNFLPLSAEPYVGMQFGQFVTQVNEELLPLVESVRSCLFSAAYIVMGYLFMLLVLYTIVAAILNSLRHKGVVPVLGMFQTANVSSEQWPERFASSSKDMYPSGSWAQSESGVYVESEDTHKAESHV